MMLIGNDWFRSYTCLNAFYLGGFRHFWGQPLTTFIAHWKEEIEYYPNLNGPHGHFSRVLV